ncbi:hypothetical protein [Rhodobaculum claviforme]|uniref:Uncharacterized protein n=1 Tax=Rhodobaculum claviforme TaxID=1549854 RepID=A0A934TDK0_9RHOB|nr:hypothetical protein [Rhodobaculum claviforme]MBK5925789.1 hypothetical protein [Rhodobaculum claviforme]
MHTQPITVVSQFASHPLATSHTQALPVPSRPASNPVQVRLSIGLSRLADALSTACVAELELVGMPAFDPALAAWREEAEAGWAAAWAHAEALAVGPGGDSAARWCRRFGRAVIDVLDAEGPAVARCGFRRIAALLQDLPAALRALEGSTLARLRVCLLRVGCVTAAHAGCLPSCSMSLNTFDPLARSPSAPHRHAHAQSRSQAETA